MNLAILFVLLFFTHQYGTPLMPIGIVEPYNLDEFICHFKRMGDLRFYLLFNSNSVVSGLWEDDN